MTPLIDYEKMHLSDLVYEFLKTHAVAELMELCMFSIDQYSEDSYQKEPRVAGNIPIGWHKSDPVLKFCMTHTIPDGLKRNSILFKNLAIELTGV